MTLHILLSGERPDLTHHRNEAEPGAWSRSTYTMIESATMGGTDSAPPEIAPQTVALYFVTIVRDNATQFEQVPPPGTRTLNQWIKTHCSAIELEGRWAGGGPEPITNVLRGCGAAPFCYERAGCSG